MSINIINKVQNMTQTQSFVSLSKNAIEDNMLRQYLMEKTAAGTKYATRISNTLLNEIIHAAGDTGNMSIRSGTMLTNPDANKFIMDIGPSLLYGTGGLNLASRNPSWALNNKLGLSKRMDDPVAWLMHEAVHGASHEMSPLNPADLDLYRKVVGNEMAAAYKDKQPYMEAFTRAGVDPDDMDAVRKFRMEYDSRHPDAYKNTLEALAERGKLLPNGVQLEGPRTMLLHQIMDDIDPRGEPARQLSKLYQQAVTPGDYFTMDERVADAGGSYLAKQLKENAPEVHERLRKIMLKNMNTPRTGEFRQARGVKTRGQYQFNPPKLAEQPKGWFRNLVDKLIGKR